MSLYYQPMADPVPDARNPFPNPQPQYDPIFHIEEWPKILKYIHFTVLEFSSFAQCTPIVGLKIVCRQLPPPRLRNSWIRHC